MIMYTKHELSSFSELITQEAPRRPAGRLVHWLGPLCLPRDDSSSPSKSVPVFCSVPTEGPFKRLSAGTRRGHASCSQWIRTNLFARPAANQPGAKNKGLKGDYLGERSVPILARGAIRLSSPSSTLSAATKLSSLVVIPPEEGPPPGRRPQCATCRLGTGN